MRTPLFWLGLFVTILFLGAQVSACSGGSASPCQGALRCNCYANSSCNAGLSCRSNVCVVEPGDSGGTTPPPGDDGGTTDEDATDDVASQDDTPAQTTPDAPAVGGPNVVTNGDFSQGAANWAIVAGNGTFTASGGKGCVAVSATQLNQTVTLGWPEPAGTPGAVLLAGTSYTFSYSASATAPISVDSKVGQTTAPYTADFETGADAVTTQVTPLSHTFTATGDPSAGIAFAFSAPAPEMVCFQNVSLIQN